MAASLAEGEEIMATNQKFQELLSTLPREKAWMFNQLCQYRGFWQSEFTLHGTLLAQQHLKSSPTDIVLISSLKSGTTWFKALMFAIFNRTRYSYESHPLLSKNPHELMPTLELYVKNNPASLSQGLPLCHTHLPYPSLPESILSSGCRIVYIHRDPKAVFVSLWHFACKLRVKELPPLSLEEAFELFARGASPYGPLWDHILGYWKASLEWPHRVLFFKYEVVKTDTIAHVKRLAEFMDHPFSLEEESKGEVNKIINLCSFENLSNLEVNKIGKSKLSSNIDVVHKAFFRKGEVADWEKHLTAEMVERLDQITEQRFKGTGLSFSNSTGPVKG